MNTISSVEFALHFSVEWCLACVIDDGQSVLRNWVDLGHEGVSNFFNILKKSHEHRILSTKVYGFGWLMYYLVIVSKIV